MSQRRFLVPPGALDAAQPGALVALPAEEAAHARKVLRLKPGDQVWLLDGQGRRARAELVSLERGQALARLEALEEEPPPDWRLVLCPGLLKTPAMDVLAVKLCELGVDQVRPFVSARAVPKAGQAGHKVERWQRLAAQALKQCGGARAPQFLEPLPLADLLAQAPPQAHKLMLYEDETGLSLAQALATLPPLAPGGQVWGLVGPEGGFAPEEAQAAQAAGFVLCGLGPRVLRAETASLALAAVLRLGR